MPAALGTVNTTTSIALASDLTNPSVVSKTGNYTVTTSDYYILCDATSGTLTLTLPAASTNSGKVFVIKKTDISVNTVIVDGNASETIDGGLTAVLTRQYELISIVTDGSNWFIGN